MSNYVLGMGIKATTAAGVGAGVTIGGALGAGIGLTSAPESAGRISRGEAGGLAIATTVGLVAGGFMLSPGSSYSVAKVASGAAIGASSLGSLFLSHQLVE